MKTVYFTDGIRLIPETDMEKNHMLECVKSICHTRTEINQDGHLCIVFNMEIDEKGK